MAKKSADEDVILRERLRHRRKRTVMGDYEGFVAAIWEQDRFRSTKERHNAREIYNRLVEEAKFTGSYRTVRQYVASKRSAMVPQD